VVASDDVTMVIISWIKLGRQMPMPSRYSVTVLSTLLPIYLLTYLLCNNLQRGAKNIDEKVNPLSRMH